MFYPDSNHLHFIKISTDQCCHLSQRIAAYLSLGKQGYFDSCNLWNNAIFPVCYIWTVLYLCFHNFQAKSNKCQWHYPAIWNQVQRKHPYIFFFLVKNHLKLTISRVYTLFFNESKQIPWLLIQIPGLDKFIIPTANQSRNFCGQKHTYVGIKYTVKEIKHNLTTFVPGLFPDIVFPVFFVFISLILIISIWYLLFFT